MNDYTSLIDEDSIYRIWAIWAFRVIDFGRDELGFRFEPASWASPFY